ncbi:uncharacterized protein LOC111704337 isoform X1 [Eurytemora carolleeae]|uniref:uncharacterized protein LOC111704337 isoform X1 n=1 Tax=Eurytemora carolleeae TaxID=1294199 RepID=UPI000C773598|nr:uncharacterized protein LOC111704337 isoform X1 [Eurytemora carolleeae]|eukprot:XP_023332330.1 uncharacterized protein LOC111704337 isoform X1 [Eurytemora affinis]
MSTFENQFVAVLYKPYLKFNSVIQFHLVFRMGVRLILLASIVGLTLSATTQGPESNCPRADACRSDECFPPECSCSGAEPVLEDREDRPQIVYLTYDDAFSAYAEENFYRSLFNGTFKNPDGCDIRATHFLTAQYTDYTLVNKYWKKGHEMASHSITHRSSTDYWKALNVTGWRNEIEGLRKMISQFAAIPKEEITGFRAPFLQLGGDEMFTALQQDGFKYDCSWASRDYGYLKLDVGLFPYTLDYETVQDCPVEPCPTCSYPGLWVQPMLDLEDRWIGADPTHPNNGMPCSMLDACIIMDDVPTKDTVKEMLMTNFLRNRNGTRAPMGLYMHAGWFYGEYSWHYEGYKDFLQEITENYDDVWIVPVNAGLDYFQNHNNLTNTEILALGDDSPFSCSKFSQPPYSNSRCDALTPCRYENVDNSDIHNQERYMHICGRTSTNTAQKCPPTYPWLGDPCGGNEPCL